MGVVSFALVGMLYKIVPFLVWYKRNSREIGRCKVPALAELYSARLQLAGYWLLLAGLALLCLATALGHSHCVKVGGTIWSAGVAAFAANMVKICLHLLPGERAAASAIPIAGGAR
jgi:hypothetical protein